MNNVNLGLLGASKIAKKVLPLIWNIKNLTIRGVAAREYEKAKIFSETFKLNYAYHSYDECLADPQIHAVYISVLNSDHAKLIEKSLNAGKHVLCEKPLVLSEADAIRLYNLANQNKLILLEGFMYRFNPQIQKVWELVNSGIIGERKSISIDFSFLLHDLENRSARATALGGGGALNDLGCYAVDFINWVTGLPDFQKPKNMKTFQKRDKEIDLQTSCIFQHSNEIEVSIHCSIDHPSINTWEIRGTKGSVAALRFDPQGSEPTTVYLINEDSKEQIIKIPQGNPFRDEFENFVQCILGNEKPFILKNESICNAQLMDAIRGAIQ